MTVYPHNNARLLGLAVVLVLGLALGGCAEPMRMVGLAPQLQSSPPPRLQVFVIPQSPIQTSEQRVFIAPIRLDPAQSDLAGPAVESLLQDTFLQARVFKVLERQDPEAPQGIDVLKEARRRGFDYVMWAEVPALLYPVGNSPGWVGLRLRIVSTRDQVTLWSLYGEADLIPQTTQPSLFGDRPYAPAPTVAEGLSALARSMADVVSKGSLVVSTRQP